MVERMRKKTEKKRVGSASPAVLIAFMVCALRGGIPANPVIAAAKTAAVTLTVEGNEVKVALELPSEAQEGQSNYDETKSLQLGFQVNILRGEGEKYRLSFVFDNEITSSVKQFSYQEETGLLQIYLSGEQDLYAGSGITLGRIVVESTGNSDVTASIRVAENSLKTVNDAFELQEQPFTAPEMVQVTADVKQTEKNSQAGEEAAENGTEKREGETGGTAGADAESLQEKTAEEDAGGTQEQKPLLRLVQAEEQERFSLKDFSVRRLLANGKTRILLGIVAAAAAALVLGIIIRIVHNQKKKKKKWW